MSGLDLIVGGGGSMSRVGCLASGGVPTSRPRKASVDTSGGDGVLVSVLVLLLTSLLKRRGCRGGLLECTSSPEWCLGRCDIPGREGIGLVLDRVVFFGAGESTDEIRELILLRSGDLSPVRTGFMGISSISPPALMACRICSVLGLSAGSGLNSLFKNLYSFSGRSFLALVTSSNPCQADTSARSLSRSSFSSLAASAF